MIEDDATKKRGMEIMSDAINKPTRLFLSILLMFSAGISQSNAQYAQSPELVPRHVFSKDMNVIDEAFLHGYTHNIVNEDVDGRKIPTLTIQCTDGGVHKPEKDLTADRLFFSVWTRDLYWGFLGWAQAGDDKVLLGLSGGVDSSVTAALIHEAIAPFTTHVFFIFFNSGRSSSAAKARLFQISFAISDKFPDE